MAMVHQQLRSSVPGAVPAPSALLPGQLALNLPDRIIYTVDSTGSIVKLGLTPDDVAPVAYTGSWNDLVDRPNVSSEYVLPPASASTLGGIRPQGGLTVDGSGILTANVLTVQGRTGNVFVTADDIGIVDVLGPDGKIEDEFLPDSILGAVTYQGTWNAATNTPTIPAPVTGNKGWYYVVNTAGTTTIGSNSSWAVGDWIISDGTQWSKITFGVSAVTAVNGSVGNVTVDANNLPGLALVGKTGAYSNLTGIPTTFPPSAHTHNVLQITDIAQVAITNSYNSLNDLPPNPSIANLGVFVQGDPTLLFDVSYIFTRGCVFTTDFENSQAVLTLNSGTIGGVSIKKNNIAIGTITRNGVLTTFTMSGTTQTFAPGDILTYTFTTSNIISAAITLQGQWTS